MTDLDRLLAQLRDEPVHPRLASIDAVVLAELSRRRAVRPLTPMVLSLAAATAMAIGIAGSALTGSRVEAAPMSPFGVPAALVPSTLLDTH